MGIGFSTFTEVVGAGPSKHFDILGIKMFDSARSASTRPAPASSAPARSRRGRARDDVGAESSPRSSGSIRRRSWSRRGHRHGALRARHLRQPQHAGRRRRHHDGARRIREKARKIAAHLLEVGEGDVEWTDYKFQVKGVPAKTVTMKDVAFAAYTNMAQNEPGSRRPTTTTPPNMTYPERRVRRGRRRRSRDRRGKGAALLAVDDCGVVINPMIVEGRFTAG
jgi:carbon-monoxide dehydrogenase large subunit